MNRPLANAPRTSLVRNLVSPIGVSPVGRRTLHTLALALGLCWLQACPRPIRHIDPPPPVVVEVGPPAWVSMPRSWEKLEAIEVWLDNDASRHEVALVLEGELQLNEGRLYFSQRDLERGSVPKDTLKVRVETAKAGFEHVLANSAASTGQRTRAQIGQRAAAALLSAPGTQDLAITTRAKWGAHAGRAGNLTPLKGTWSRITVHHSDEDSSDPKGGSFEDSAATVRAIQKFHMEDASHQWGDIGYHFLIDGGGRIFEGRELKWQGAHAGGSGGVNNVQNIGICMLGNLVKRPPTPAALKSLQLLLENLCEKYRIQKSRIYVHNELVTTVCPGAPLTAWVKKFRE